MKCRQVRVYLSPYLDSELDPTTTYEVSRHLELCPGCAALFQAEGELERAIAERLRRVEGDEEAIVERALAHVLARRGHAPRWWMLAAAVLLIAGLSVVRFAWPGGEPIPSLVAMAAEDHRRLLLGEIAPELRSDDPAKVAAFFYGRLAGDIGTLPAGDGWAVEGARVCHFEGRAVGAVILRYQGVPVSVIDVPAQPSAELATRCIELPGGRALMGRTAAGIRVVFGDVEMARLEEVLRAAN